MSKLIAFGDSHGHLPELPAGKYLVFVGDYQKGRMVYDDAKAEARRFMRFIGSQPHQHKILITGNHDDLFWMQPMEFAEECDRNHIYLMNSTDLNDPFFKIQRIGDLVFAGTHHGYRHAKWPNALTPDLPLADHYDVLLTHGPAYGILDFEPRGMENCGNQEWRQKMQDKLYKPKLHLFGHIHDQYGRTRRFCNVALSSNDDKKGLVNKPMIIDVSGMERKDVR